MRRVQRLLKNVLLIVSNRYPQHQPKDGGKHDQSLHTIIGQKPEPPQTEGLISLLVFSLSCSRIITRLPIEAS
jgi:hypothetical protein